MKKNILFLLVAILFSVNSNAQSYSFGAGFIETTLFKIEGKILISDSTVQIILKNKEIEKINKYSVVKKANEIIYITDGVMTHSINILSQSGKKKGFDYDNIIIMNYDKNQPGGIDRFLYYSKLEN